MCARLRREVATLCLGQSESLQDNNSDAIRREIVREIGAREKALTVELLMTCTFCLSAM